MAITDGNSAQAWLETQEHPVQIAFAARCALRAAPGLGCERPLHVAPLAYSALRTLLCAVVSAARPSPEHIEIIKAVGAKSSNGTYSISYNASYNARLLPRHTRDLVRAAEAAANSASDAARSARDLDYNPARMARDAASSVTHAAHDSAQLLPSSPATRAISNRVYYACERDAARLAPQEGKPLEMREVFATPLWPTDPHGDIPAGEPEGLAEGYAKLTALFDSDLQVWSFWKRWLEGMRTGQPMDWKLQEQIALIPDEVWEAGPEEVAAAIKALEAQSIASILREDIATAENGKLVLIPQEIKETQHLGRLLDTVADALDLATSGQRNALSEDAYQVRLLRRTFARYGNDPQRIEMDFERARVSLLEDIAADDLPASAANRDLIQSLADASGSIRESDPEIRANRARLTRIRLGEIAPEDAHRIADMAVAIAEHSEGVLAEDLRDDRFALPGVTLDAPVPRAVVPLGGAERNKALAAQAAQIRLFSRLSKVWLFLKAHPSEVAIITGIVGTLASVIGVIVAISAL